MHQTRGLSVGTPEFDGLVVLECRGGNDVGARMTRCGEHNVCKQIRAESQVETCARRTVHCLVKTTRVTRSSRVAAGVYSKAVRTAVAGEGLHDLFGLEVPEVHEVVLRAAHDPLHRAQAQARDSCSLLRPGITNTEMYSTSHKSVTQ